MFNKKTVFVIGAGASVEFAMPSGDSLKNQIAQLLSRENRRRGNSELQRFIDVLAIANTQWETLLAAGQHLADAMPSFISIDEALHYFSDDPNVSQVGKYAIAYILLNAESQCPIRFDKKTQRVSVKESAETWLHEFLSMALSFSRRVDARSAFEHVSFINFNYDRVVEHYLVNALQSVGRLPLDTAHTITKGINIIRPYGSLGKLPWQAGAAWTDFGSDLVQNPRVADVANGILTYTEQLSDAQTTTNIVNTLHAAELVIVIGFGFHQQNMALLRSTGADRPVFATSFGIDENNHEMFSQDIAKFFGSRNVRLIPKKGYDFMHNLRPTISAAAG